MGEKFGLRRRYRVVLKPTGRRRFFIFDVSIPAAISDFPQQPDELGTVRGSLHIAACVPADVLAPTLMGWIATTKDVNHGVEIREKYNRRSDSDR